MLLLVLSIKRFNANMIIVKTMKKIILVALAFAMSSSLFAEPIRTYSSPHRFDRYGGEHEETLRFDDGESVLLRYRNGVLFSERWYDASGKYKSSSIWINDARRRHREYRNHRPRTLDAVYDDSPVVMSQNQSVVVQTPAPQLSAEQILAAEQARQMEIEREKNRPSEIRIAAVNFDRNDSAPMPPVRIWHDHKGGEIRAFWIGVSEDGDKIVLKTEKTGKTINAARHKFSEEDRKYLRDEFSRLRAKGYEIHDGWWYRSKRRESEEVKNGGF